MTELRRFTMARVGIGRAGNSMPTRALLEFQLAHAQARDAVHFPLDVAALEQEFESEVWPVLPVRSAARDRAEYLRRPDLGRRLYEPSKLAAGSRGAEYDVVFVVADGLSALAVQHQATGLLRRAIGGLKALGWSIAPLVIVEQGRVAVADEIGFALNAGLSVILIGERPGLTSFDSMGIYLTWSPRPGKTDAERNCISNIRLGGLSLEAAADLLLFLLQESRARQLSGIELRAPQLSPPRRFPGGPDQAIETEPGS